MAQAFGIAYRSADTLEELREALNESGAHSLIVEVRTDRQANAALHREIKDQVASAVTTLLEQG